MTSNRLVNASQAPRCQHLKVNGLRCGSPARHGRDFCCFHDSAARRNGEFVLPIIEDASSLQLALNKIMQALVDKLIDQKTASILLYGLQIASANLKRLDGERRYDDYLRSLHKQVHPEPEKSSHAPDAQPARIPPASAQENAAQPGADANAITSRKSPIANDNTPRFDIEASAAVDREEEQERLRPPTHVPLRPRLVM